MIFSRKMEAETLHKMIVIYCKQIHGGFNQELCPECQEIEQYALTRIDKCPYAEQKPVCSKCRIHCYKPEMRDRIKKIMRYSGPRMLTKHPLLTIRYLYRKQFANQEGIVRGIPRGKNEH